MPKQQIIFYSKGAHQLIIKHIISNFKISFSVERNQLWLPKLVKQVTDFAWCQREFFVTKTR